MRIVSLIVTVFAVLFSFVAIACVAVASFFLAIIRSIFGRRAETPRHQQTPPAAQARPARFNSDDAIDVVTTPVAKD